MVICIFADHLGQTERMAYSMLMGMQIRPLPWLAMKFMFSVVQYVGGADEVAFVFAVRVIGDDDDVAGL